MKRQRGRGRKPNGQPNRPLESNVGGQKTRGTATQVYERYQQLARDAASAGDHVAAENYLQHAEHYFRIMRANQQAQRERAENEARANEGREAEAGARTEEGASAPPASAGPLEVVTPEASDLSAQDGEESPSEPAPARRPRRARKPRSPNGANEGEDARQALKDAPDEGGAALDPAPSA